MSRATTSTPSSGRSPAFPMRLTAGGLSRFMFGRREGSAMKRYTCCLVCVVSYAMIFGSSFGSTASTGCRLVAGEERPPPGIPNASFEEEGARGPLGWRRQTWRGRGEFDHASVARTGRRSLRIRSERGADAGWYAVVPVEMRSKYRLSGWIRTENVATTGGARGALLNIHNIQPVATNAITGTQDWTRVEVVFDTDLNDAIQINCLFGGWGLATGTAWFDDLRLERLSTETWDPRVRIDTRHVGEPISKYIYGQFIEHLGRCIYGGIWAEMLEDRKFCLAVGEEGSPWKPVGDETYRTDVTVAREDSFVGEHTPRIQLPGAGREGGIVQAELGLVAGRRYVGRVWLAGDASAAPVEVRLVWGDRPHERQSVTIGALTAEYARFPLRFTSGGSTERGRLEIVSRGGGVLRVGTVSLMPADNVEGLRADTLALLRELDAPVYRWPGGNFVSGYDWKDGIGDPDRRPPRKNPAWRGIEHNDFGLDEFMKFCRLLDTEPYVVVNSGQGEVGSALEELQYVNGETSTPMGALRARNGHAEPYRVKWWGIGNEMYGDWQLGHIPLERYIEKHNRFARAMRDADASIRLIAVGAVGRWSEGMLAHCAEHMDLISEHFYRQEGPGLAAHVHQIPRAVRGIAEAHRGYRERIPSLAGRDIRIALDEWNYWYGPHVYGELGTRYFLKDALGVAAGLGEMARQSDLFFMANYAQTVNVIGCIKTTKTAASFATTGLVLKLYRRHFGTLSVSVESSPPLDVAAALTADRKALTVAVVNPLSKRLEVPLELEGVSVRSSAERWQITGDDPMDYNEPGKPPAVSIAEDRVEDLADRLTVAPWSVTLLRFEVASGGPANIGAGER